MKNILAFETNPIEFLLHQNGVTQNYTVIDFWHAVWGEKETKFKKRKEVTWLMLRDFIMEQKPDFVVINWISGGMYPEIGSTTNLVSVIAKHSPHSKIIFTSTIKDRVEEVLSAGAHCFVPKLNGAEIDPLILKELT